MSIEVTTDNKKGPYDLVRIKVKARNKRIIYDRRCPISRPYQDDQAKVIGHAMIDKFFRYIGAL